MNDIRQTRGRGLPLRTEVVEVVRSLVEGTALPMRAVAETVGVSRGTVTRLAARHGWSRPLPPRVSLEGRRGGGARIVPEVVAEARRLLEGTHLSYEAVAIVTDVSPTTLCRWCKRGGWRRLGVADAPARPTRYRRGRGLPYAADAVGTVRRLLAQTLLSQKRIAAQAGVSQGQVSVWLRRRGWTRPEVAPGSRRFAASRRTGPLAQEGDRRGRPYAPEVKREARALWELTRLPTSLIGARLGAHPGTVARWAREDAWERPRGRAGRAQLAGFFGTLRWQV